MDTYQSACLHLIFNSKIIFRKILLGSFGSFLERQLGHWKSAGGPNRERRELRPLQSKSLLIQESEHFWHSSTPHSVHSTGSRTTPVHTSQTKSYRGVSTNRSV